MASGETVTQTVGRVQQLPKGEYNAQTTYNKLDIVSYQGSSYICKQDNTTGQVPTNTTYWMINAQKGDTGEQGIQGIQGIQGETGATGAKGDKGYKGDKGDKGDTGATGQAGHTPVKGTDYFTPQDIADMEEDILESEVIEDLETRVSLLEGSSKNLTWKDISDIVRAGKAQNYFNIGDQIMTTYKDTANNNTEYEMPLDVVAFQNVTILDENEQEQTVPRNDITKSLLYTFWSTIYTKSGFLCMC